MTLSPDETVGRKMASPYDRCLSFSLSLAHFLLGQMICHDWVWQNLRYCYLQITTFLLIADICALSLTAVFLGYSNLTMVSWLWAFWAPIWKSSDTALKVISGLIPNTNLYCNYSTSILLTDGSMCMDMGSPSASSWAAEASLLTGFPLARCPVLSALTWRSVSACFLTSCSCFWSAFISFFPFSSLKWENTVTWIYQKRQELFT